MEQSPVPGLLLGGFSGRAAGRTHLCLQNSKQVTKLHSFAGGDPISGQWHERRGNCGGACVQQALSTVGSSAVLFG